MRKETNQNMIPRNAVKQCNKCGKRVNYTATCPKYPERIPYKVLTGEDCPEFEAKEQSGKQDTPSMKTAN